MAFGSTTLNTTNVPTNMNPSPSTSTFIKDIFYRSPNGISNSSTNRNKLLFGLPQGKDYYNSHLPPRATSTKPIDNSLFGTGYMSNGLKRLPDISGFTYTNTATPSANAIPSSLYQAGSASNAPGTINLYKYKTGASDFSPTLPPSMKYFNINMVFPTARTSEQTAAINTCKDLIKSKLSVCGNYNNWSSPNKTGCISCFDIRNATSQGLCSRYPEYVSGLLGNVNTPPPDDATPADLGVCGILEQGRSGDKPWAFFDVTHEPEDFGTHLPTVSPYNTTSRTCNKLISDATVTTFTNTHNPIEFIPIQHAGSSNTAGTGVIENVAFFKPARSSSSDVFEDGHTNLSETPFGCMRKDLSYES